MNAINRIVVIGNGFDLAHKLPTKYIFRGRWGRMVKKQLHVIFCFE